MKLRKRNDDRYCISMQFNKKRKWLYGATYRQVIAKARKERLQQLYRYSAPQATKTQELTLSKWLDKWYELYKVPKNRPSTLYKQRKLIDIIVKDEIGNLHLNNLTAETIQNFVNSISATRQREHIYVLLKDALKKAYQIEILTKNIAAMLEKPSHDTVETVILSKGEIDKFLSAVQNSPHALFYKIILYEGLRPSEVFALKRENIDLENAKIYVKTSRDKYGEREPKTKAGIRAVPIFNTSLQEELKALKSSDSSAYLFDFFDYAHYYNNICDKCEIIGTTAYSLRHTFATNCAENGVSPKILQKWLGHSEIKITLKHYVHVNSEWENSEITKMTANKPI